MLNAGDIHERIAKVCPIQGLSLDGQTVSVRYSPDATAQQKAAAKAAIDAIDWNAPSDRDTKLAAARKHFRDKREAGTLTDSERHMLALIGAALDQ